MTRDRLYLAHIADSIERIRRYTTGGRAAFLDDQMIQDAVLRNLQVLGESARLVSEETRNRAPDIAWTAIAGFRNVLVHEYLTVNVDHVWMVVERDVPALRDAVQRLLGEPH